MRCLRKSAVRIRLLILYFGFVLPNDKSIFHKKNQNGMKNAGDQMKYLHHLKVMNK